MSTTSINPTPDRQPVKPGPTLAYLLDAYLRAVQLAAGGAR